MHKRLIIRTYIFITVSTLLIGACGGGGGDGSDGPGTGGSPPPLNPPPPVNNTNTVSDVFNSRNVGLSDHDVVLNDSGDGIAYWRESNGNTYLLMANHYQNGRWATAQSIGLSAALSPRINLNDAGAAVAVWAERTFDSFGIGIVRNEIWAAHYRNTVWETPVRISSATPAPVDTTWFAADPKIALDSNGNALAVWVLSDSSLSTSSGVYYSKFNGVSWSSPQLLNNGTHGVNSLSLTMAANANGNAIITWAQNTNLYDPGRTAGWGTPNLWGTLYSDGSFTAAQLVGDMTLPDFDGVGDAVDTNVSINNTGNAVVTWQESRAIAPRYRILSRQANSSGFATTFITVDTSATSNDLLSLPVVSIDDADNILYAWRRNIATGGSIPDGLFRFYNANGTTPAASSELFEDSDDGLDLFIPVTTNRAGDFFLLWKDWPSTVAYNPAIRLRKYSQPGGLATSITNAGYGSDPRMATNTLGESLIVALKSGIQPSSGFTSEIIGIYVPVSP